jgi:hypothetical protein
MNWKLDLLVKVLVGEKRGLSGGFLEINRDVTKSSGFGCEIVTILSCKARDASKTNRSVFYRDTGILATT